MQCPLRVVLRQSRPLQCRGLAGLPGLERTSTGVGVSAYSPRRGELPLAENGLLYFTEGPTHGLPLDAFSRRTYGD